MTCLAFFNNLTEMVEDREENLIINALFFNLAKVFSELNGLSTEAMEKIVNGEINLIPNTTRFFDGLREFLPEPPSSIN